MIQSMTGYGRAEVEGAGHRVVVEARSLNSRYLDVNLRLPPGWWGLEPIIRRRIQERFRRGRLEVHLRFEMLRPDEEPEVELQLGKAKSYRRALEELRTVLEIPGTVDLALMASFRDLVNLREMSWEEEQEALERGLERALDALEAMREEEGKAIQTDIEQRIEWMEGELERMRGLAPRVVEEQTRRWRERLENLVDERHLDPDRLEQEMAIWVDRLDVVEELVRLTSHLRQFRGMLEQGRGIGRKLEFLLQETHREVNTLGTKAMDAEVSHWSVEMKAQIERIRELVQNVE